MSLRLDPQRLSLMVQAATTEHFALQSARTAIASESVGRASLYLSSVSGALIAMGFLAPLLQGRLIFIQICLVLLGALFLLGIVTCVRLTQLAIDDMSYQRAINRLRHWYLDIGPDMRPYFMLSDRDDLGGVLQNITMKPSGWQVVFSTNGALGLVNSLLGAAATVMAVHAATDAAFAHSLLFGIAFAVASAVLHAQTQTRMWERAEQGMDVMFPSADPPHSPTA